ncbi:response regulator [Pedobacter panaciterrae]
MDELLIYIADDHAIFVEGLSEILKAQPHLKIIGTATDGQELVELMLQRKADLVILDINMPKLNGIQCTEWIKKIALKQRWLY